MNENIEQAIELFRDQSGRYRRTRRYYAGDHDLSFATEKFTTTFGDLFREFALNLCPPIVDSVKDKLKIRGFGVCSPHVNKGSSRPTGALTHVRATDTERDESRTLSENIWRANKMAIRAGEVHKEVLKNGDAYVIVWPGADGTVQIFPNAAETCTVRYDDENPGRVLWAAKYWRTRDKRTRLNLFFPDRIEKYISKSELDGYLPDARGFALVPSHRALQPSLFPENHRDEEGHGTRDLGQGTLPNPFGVVPVFHFANNADIGAFGQSELLPAMPIQDGLNKSVLDMLVAMEVSAFRQRWVAGITPRVDPETDEEIPPFKTGVDRLWVASGADAKFGDFHATDLEQFLKVKDGFRIDLSSATGTPLYYLMPQIQGFPSGESLRKAETRFLAKVRDRQEQFGSVWADVMSLALKMSGHDGVQLETEWEEASPLTEREMLENEKLRKELGV